MKFVDPSFDILTDISSGGIKELKHIERCGRVSYRSEDKITEDGESAKKFVAMLISKRGCNEYEYQRKVKQRRSRKKAQREIGRASCRERAEMNYRPGTTER